MSMLTLAIIKPDAVAARHTGKIIAQLTQEFETRRQAIVAQLVAKLNGRLSPEDKAYVEGAFRLLQNQFLHGPISALSEEAPEPGRHTLLEALRKRAKGPGKDDDQGRRESSDRFDHSRSRAP